MKLLCMLVSLAVLGLPALSRAAVYDFAFYDLSESTTNPQYLFSIDTSTGVYDSSSEQTNFQNINFQFESMPPSDMLGELDLTGGAGFIANAYEDSGVEFALITFGTADDVVFSNGEGSSTQFSLGDFYGSVLHGRQVAPADLHISLANDAPAAPEPQTWLLMAAGVGSAGWALRRGRAPVALA